MHTPEWDQDKEQLSEEFSLERRNPPAKKPVPAATPAAVSFFRFIVWISPGPACILIVIGLSQISYRIPPFVFYTLGIACTYGIGYFDALLSPAVPKVNNTPVVDAALRHALIFSLVQIILAPLVLLALAFGFCAIVA